MRHEFFLSCLIYKALYLNQKPLISQDLHLFEPRLRRGDVRQDYRVLPNYHSVEYDKSFLVSAIKIWNQLPNCCTSKPTFNEFLNSCYEYSINEN